MPRRAIQHSQINYFRLAQRLFKLTGKRRSPLMKLSRVGVDLAKYVYQLHGVDRHGKTVWKRRLRRNQWLHQRIL